MKTGGEEPPPIVGAGAEAGSDQDGAQAGVGTGADESGAHANGAGSSAKNRAGAALTTIIHMSIITAATAIILAIVPMLQLDPSTGI